MSRNSDSRKNDHDNSDDPNVIQLGFNISVSGKPASDFEIYVNDKKQPCGQLSVQNSEQKTSSAEHPGDQKFSGLTGEKSTEGLCLDKLSESDEPAFKGSRHRVDEKSPLTLASGETECSKSSRSEDVRIIDEIKNAMGNFEKFSEHLREIPRLSTKGIYTSTPFPDKNNSRSEGNLSLYGNVPRSYIPKHDFRDRKYFKKPKPLSNELFLKPLPAEDYFKKGFIRRYYDMESYHRYSSMENLPHYYEYGGEWKNSGKTTTKSDNDKSDALSSSSDVCASETKALSKKGDGNEVVDKQSTSSESTKDIKIYQSGGIIIMQNFKDSTDLLDKDFVDGVKLIDNCNKLKEKMENSLHSSDESQKLLLNSSSDDVKGQSTKSVQFDLSSFENNRSKSCDSSSDMQKNDVSSARSENYKGKEAGFLFPQNQDFTSLSTQENDSILSNLVGMSPTSSTSGKKLEWDSGADVGYLNMDLTKENISTIERIILKGLSDDGTSKKQVIYQRSEQDKTPHPSKFILERLPSELELEVKNNSTSEPSNSDHSRTPSGKANTSTATSQSSGDQIHVSKERSNTDCKGFEDSRIEKCQASATDKTNLNNRKSSKKSKVTKSSEDAKFSKSGTGVGEAKNKKILSDFKSSHKEEKFPQPPKFDYKKDMVLFSDKSTYVNTLFDDMHFDLPIQDLSRSDESGRSESSERFGVYHLASPKMKKLTKKKKNSSQGSELSPRPKGKIETAIDLGKHSDGSNERQKSNGSAEQNDDINTEKIPETGVVNEDGKHVNPVKKLSCVEKSNQTDKTARSRPISASSSSVRTVMHNVEAPENDKIPLEVKNFADQIIQTCEPTYESKGIQAFQSAKCSVASSQLGEGTPRNLGDICLDISGVKVLEEDNSKSILVCSKSIQAPGMNSSLPKHLSHPKQNVPWNHINTKSTQFFGGPVTSLPNYHSNLPLREMIIAKDKILMGRIKNLMNSDSENNRIVQENVRNSSVRKPDERKFVTECKFTCTDNKNSVIVDDRSDGQQRGVNEETNANKNNIENKENLTADEEKLTNYSVHQSHDSRRKGSKTNCSVNSGSIKSDSMVFGSCEVLPSDDGKNLFLTSELLKEHGDHIDRNIIQEKYFQSQLIELERMEMISRATSMERKSQHERNTQTSFSPVTGVSVSCQYSPSLMNVSDEVAFYSKTDSGKSSKENEVKSAWTDQNSRVEYASSQRQKKSQQFNTGKTSPEDFVLIESLSSDTQTADSWIPGAQQNSENQVEEAPNFEYSQEHIYDDPTSLKEKSVNENEKKIQLVDSIQSNGTSSTLGTDSRAKNSESGHTLVLENTDVSEFESERLKGLDNNLTELEVVVSRLHEKESIFQKITDSVLSTVSKINGSGDSSINQQESRSNDNSNRTEEISCGVEIMEESSKSNGSEGKKRDLQENKPVLNEISTACQTDTMKPDPLLFDKEKKKLEERMTDEKEQQIKWIENEIKHLNMLRSLLEKQEDIKIPIKKKKRNHYLTETSEESSTPALMKEEIFKKILTDTLTKTSSSTTEGGNGDRSKSESPPLKLNEKSLKQLSSSFTTTPECPQLGMAFSLRRIDKTREVTMLPVGIQVKLRDQANRSRAGTAPGNSRDSVMLKQDVTRVKSIPATSVTEVTTQDSNLNTQYNNSTSTTAISSASLNRCECYKCTTSKCGCIKSNEVSERRKSGSSGSRQSGIHEPEPVVSNRQLSNKELEIPEIRDIADSRRGSANETLSGKMPRYSKEEPSYVSSPEPLSFEKCVCHCHAQPLPRCNSCHLLNTCKKCQCYRRIKCCICEVDASHKTCPSTTSCQCKVGVCQFCLYCGGKNQICAICSCHMKVASRTCKHKRNYKEKSCQTVGKDCKCCQCNGPVMNEEDKYRETKYMTEEQHVTEIRKSSTVSYPSEQRFEVESKQSMDEKFPFQMKVPVEKKNSVEIKNATQIKAELENLNAEQFQSLPVKELQGNRQCRCKSRQSRRTSYEDHPRHYFLQVEETTEEESSESCENGSALDVITIKVPIRKVCKNGKNTQSSPPRNTRKKMCEDGVPRNNYVEEKIFDRPEYNCCEDCIGHSSMPSSFEKRPQTANSWTPRVSFESKRRSSNDVDPCECCEDCPGRAKLEERPRPEFAICDDYEQQKARSMSYTKFNVYDVSGCQRNCCNANVSKPLKYPSEECRYKETDTETVDECNCCHWCDEEFNPVPSGPESSTSEVRKDDESEFQSNGAELSASEVENEKASRIKEKPVGNSEKKVVNNTKSDKQKKGDKTKKVPCKTPTSPKSSRAPGPCKSTKASAQEKSKDKKKNNDYYNFNKKEYMTKSELEMEEKKKRSSRLTLQECLTTKRPDLYTRAECRRKIISEKSRDRVERQKKRMDCLIKVIPQCDVPPKNPDLKLFTSAQMKKQTRKFYKKLPEVTSKKEEEKKKMIFQTNKLMAEIFSKKLQLQTLNGRLNMSNSFSVMSTILMKEGKTILNIINRLEDVNEVINVEYLLTFFRLDQLMERKKISSPKLNPDLILDNFIYKSLDLSHSLGK